MTVKKPSWLSQWLNLFNWDIFTWKVYAGDAIEHAIDWALQWVNWGIDQATLAYNKAVAAWYKAVELAGDLRSTIYRETGYLWNKVNQWAADLAEWWEGTSTKVRGWIDVAKSWAKERIDDAWKIINRVDVAWDNFRRDTLPKLLDTQWVISFFGKGVHSISDWWAARRGEIDTRLDAEITPVRDEVNKHSSWLDLIKWLITNPLEWKDAAAETVLKTIENILARLW